MSMCYSHFISNITLLDKGGNICPLLAWHVYVWIKKKEKEKEELEWEKDDIVSSIIN